MLLTDTLSIEQPVPKKKFLFGLLAAVFSTNVIDVLAPLLYPEIAQTFGIQIGTAVQLSVFSALAGVITGFVLSAFSIKVRYKTLLMVGVLCIICCALGVFLAPNFLFAQIFYSLNGVGSVIVGVMVASLIGELYPLNMKAKTFSWTIAAGQIAVLVGNPITGYIANSGAATGWKTALLWFILPITIISFLLVFFFIPSKPKSNLLLTKKPPLREGFRVEQASLIKTPVGWNLSTEKIIVPNKVKDIIGRRIEALKINQRRVLYAASVLGEQFTPNLLAQVANQEKS